MDNDLKLDYIITRGWSQKAAASAARLFEKEKVNVVANANAKQSNGGKFRTIPSESTWKLSKNAAQLLCTSAPT